MRFRRRCRPGRACSLEASPEEEELQRELQRIDEERKALIAAAQAGAKERAKEIAKRLAEKRREVGSKVANRLVRCARVLAKAAPDDVSVCFRFKGGDVQMVIPDKSPIREPSVARGAKRAMYEADYKAGLKISEIAKKHDVTASTVWSALYRDRSET